MLESFGGQFEAEKLTARLGDFYALLTNGFKQYCCAIDIHSSIDALTRVVTAHDLGPQIIAEIIVPLARTVKLHSGMIGPEPRDITGAQLSQPYSLALTVGKRSNSFTTYIDALKSGFKEPVLLAVARKVSIAEFPDPPGDQSLIPGQVKSPPLTVKTTDGKTYTEELRPSMGSPQNPMTHEELENKFMGLATRVVPEEQASKIAATVRNLEEIEELRDLTDLWSAHPTEARRDQTVFARAPQRSFPASARRIVDQGRSSPGSRSLPFFDRSGSVHAERLKQQGRLFPLFIFEMLTSTRRLRVSGFVVALTQRTHSQRAIGVISFHRFWIFGGAATRAVARSWGTLGSGQSLVTSISSLAVSPALMPAACCSVSSILIQ
jgi:MmgE/PrpD C-terminal domain